MWPHGRATASSTPYLGMEIEAAAATHTTHIQHPAPCCVLFCSSSADPIQPMHRSGVRGGNSRPKSKKISALGQKNLFCCWLYGLLLLKWTCSAHTIQKRPPLIRTAKSTWIGPHQYWVEGSPGNPGWRCAFYWKDGPPPLDPSRWVGGWGGWMPAWWLAGCWSALDGMGRPAVGGAALLLF